MLKDSITQTRESKLDFELNSINKFQHLFNIEHFFNDLNKLNNTLAVPFILGAKDISFKCGDLYQQQLKDIKEIAYYCADEEHKTIYATTGSKIITCKNCPNFKTRRNK